MPRKSEINALIQLLDDDDQEVFKHVHDRLKSYGPEVIPDLEQVWTDELNSTTHERLEEIIHEIQYECLLTDWKTWLDRESPDLLTGAFLVAQYHYPEIKFEDTLKKIAKLKQGIWLELNYNQTPLEQVQIFNQVFYAHHEFKGVQSVNDYHDLCINHLLESRTGSPIVTGIIYQVLANELNLPVYGVNLTRHYVLAFCKRTILDFSLAENNEREVMFYINPINRGSIFSRNEIKDYLDKLKIEHEPVFFTPSDNKSIIKELLNYLIDIYGKQNNESRIREISYLMQLM